jgi:cellulose biosynthesis protein BcsQ
MPEKLSVLLAGPGHELVFYQMQPAFVADARLMVAGQATTWDALQNTLGTLKPEILVVHASIAPGADPLIKLLATLQAWGGVAVVILPEALANFQGAFSNLSGVVAGVFVMPVNWAEIPERAYNAGTTARYRSSQISAGPQFSAPSAFSPQGMTPIVTGTKRIAVFSHAGGAGASTVAENLAYELAARLSVRTLLFSLGLPPAAAAHFRLRYIPNLTEFFERPGKPAIQSAIQKLEGLDILLAPESSLEYLKAASTSVDLKAPNSIYSMFLAAEDGSYAAMVMDLPLAESEWLLHPLFFANLALIVARPTMADLFAVRHTLNFLGSLGNRLPREALYLVLNQASETSALTPRRFLEELSGDLGWAPPIAAVIEHDPQVQMAQDQRVPPVLRSEKLSRGVRQVIGTLFPGMERAVQMSPETQGSKSFLRLPKFKLG